jgi:carbon-monoxide dehydrogenase medium subunit
LLSQHSNDSTAIVAGGTDVIVMMKNQMLKPTCMVAIDDIKSLKYINQDADGLKVGALTTMTDIANSPIVNEKFKMLSDAAEVMGSPQVRNTATIVGNLSRACPSADTAIPLLALGANLKVVSVDGEKLVSLDDFFIGPGETVLENTDLITEIQVPNPAPNASGTYLRIASRTALAIAIVGVAAVITYDSQKSQVIEAKIVLGAVAPTPIRATKAEEMLKGQTVDEKLIEEAAKASAEEAKPISDVRGSAAYRKEMVRVLTANALKQTISI